MNLFEFLDLYRVEREIEPETVLAYSNSIKVLHRYTGKTLLLSELSPDLMNRWLEHLRQKDRAPAYRKSLRTAIMAMWRLAWELDTEHHKWDVTRPRARRVKPWIPNPIPWTDEEFKRLIAACDELPDYFPNTGRKRSTYYRTIVKAGRTCCLRWKDLVKVRREEIKPDGRFSVVQHKTGKPVSCWVSPATLAEIDQFCPSGVIWPCPGHYETFRKWFTRAVKSAGLVGTFKKIRKTGGNEWERLNPGRGHIRLGNERRTAELSYLSQEVLEDGMVEISEL